MILGVARENPTDGIRMVAAFASRDFGAAINRKLAQRLMRELRLLQRHRPLGRRRRPGFFRVERPDQLLHMDMTSVWVAEHGWCYLNAAIVDRCTRGSPAGAWTSAAAPPTRSPSSTRPSSHRQAGDADAGHRQRTALTARAFRARLSEHGIVHHRGGYRDPESQAFIESWFGKPKERCVWRDEFERFDEARKRIGAYIENYHHRPHPRLAYRTSREVAATWKAHDDHLTRAA